MVLLLFVGPVLLPEYRDRNAGRIDLLSVSQSLVAVLGIIYGLKQLAEHGFGWPPAVALAVGLAVGAGFALRQVELSYPLLDLHLFRRPRFGAAIAAYGLSCLAMFGVYIFVTQYLQLVLGLGPLPAGLATMPWAFAFIASSLMTARLGRRWGPASVLIWWLAIAATGFALLALSEGRFAIFILVGGIVILSLGLAPVFTICNDMVMSAAPPERAGAASALAETALEFMGALGIAVLGSIGAIIYRRVLATTMPGRLPDVAANDALATLGAAAAIAIDLNTPADAALLAAARSAFSESFHAVAVIALVIAVSSSFLSARLPRDRSRQPSR